MNTKVVCATHLAMYVTKQASRYYYNKGVGAMKKMQFQQSGADPFLFFKWHTIYGLVMRSTWIDDKLCLAHKNVIEKEEEELRSILSVMT